MGEKKILLLLALGILILFGISFSSSSFLVTPSPLSLNLSQSYIINLTINNTGSTNITQINLTLPEGFTYVSNSNGSNRVSDFNNLSNVLSWQNSSNLIIGEYVNDSYVWFNSSFNGLPGSYIINLSTLESSGNISLTSINVSIIDNVVPNITQIISPSNNGVYSGNVVLNVSASDVNSGIILVNINVTNSSGTVLMLNLSHNFVSNYGAILNSNLLGDGNYTLFAYAYDNSSIRNYNVSQSILITIDNHGPVISLVSPTDGRTSTDSSYNFSFVVTAPVSISNCTLKVDGLNYNFISSVVQGTNYMYNSSFETGSHSWYVVCLDNRAITSESDSYSFRVSTSSSSSNDDDDDSSSSSSSSNSNNNNNYWSFTYMDDGASLESKGEITRVLQKKERIRFKFDSKTQYLGIIDLTSSSTTINLSGSGKTSMTEGQLKKFNINGDDFYDLSVKINDLQSDEVNITIVPLHEKMTIQNENMTESILSTITNNQTGSESQANEISSNSMWIWASVALAIILLVVLLGYYFWRKGQDMSFRRSVTIK
jgi:hypothetical protein